MRLLRLAAVSSRSLVPAAFGGGAASYPQSANLRLGKIFFVAACGGGMPALGESLTRTQIKNIAAYVVRSTPTSGARDD